MLKKLKKQISNIYLTNMVKFTGKNIYDALKGAKEMGIDINQMLEDTDDYNIFMENLFKFYNDFKGGEN